MVYLWHSWSDQFWIVWNKRLWAFQGNKKSHPFGICAWYIDCVEIYNTPLQVVADYDSWIYCNQGEIMRWVVEVESKKILEDSSKIRYPFTPICKFQIYAKNSAIESRES